MNYERIEKNLKEIGQSHLLEYFDELSEEKKKVLLGEIESTNFSVIENIRNGENQKQAGNYKPCPAKSLEDIQKNKAEYEEAGLKLLKDGKCAAVLLAGGQGTRLGFDKPKGMFDMGESRYLPIFGLLMENVKAVAGRAGRSFHLFVMTSRENNSETVDFFRQNSFFGYPENKVHFYIQDTEPACDFDGKVFLAEKHRLALTPNGNGGWYSSLINGGYGELLKTEGIEWLNVFGVDNVLQKICDPAFLGATALSGCSCSSKVVKKTCAEEKVGVLCEQDFKPCIVEYYELPSELANAKDKNGELKFCYGVILNYLFNTADLDRVFMKKLPYHKATKKISHIENGVRVIPEQPNGFKFETLVVDMVKYMGSCLAYEVKREREFAPVKNKTGVDSVDTAKALLKENGIGL